MNRRIAAIVALVVLIAALGVSSALAQEKSPLSFGLKLGLNISDIRGTGIDWVGDLFDWKAGFCGGAYMSYAVNDWFSLQPELLYSMKGMKMGLFGSSLISFSLDYIEIPVLATAKIFPKNRFHPFVYAGPDLGFNVRSSASADLFEDVTLNQDLSSVVNSTEFSLAFGAGMNVVIAKRELTLDLRYVRGLTNIFKDEATGDYANWQNSTTSLLVGFGL